jgi:hypothetical protein
LSAIDILYSGNEVNDDGLASANLQAISVVLPRITANVSVLTAWSGSRKNIFRKPVCEVPAQVAEASALQIGIPFAPVLPATDFLALF